MAHNHGEMLTCLGITTVTQSPCEGHSTSIRHAKATLPLARPLRVTIWLCLVKCTMCVLVIPTSFRLPRASLVISALICGAGGRLYESQCGSPRPMPMGLRWAQPVGPPAGGQGAGGERWAVAPPASSPPWLQVSGRAAASVSPRPTMSSGNNASHSGIHRAYFQLIPSQSRHN